MYSLRFDVESYFGRTCDPEVVIAFRVRVGAEHVPLLLSRNAYSTHRRS